LFHDPQLNALELQVNVSNQNLKAAEAQYTKLGHCSAIPPPICSTVNASPSATRVKTSSNRPPPAQRSMALPATIFKIPFELSYQIDVWTRPPHC